MIISRVLNAQLIHQHFFCASHQHIIQMSKHGIYTGLPKSIPTSPHTCCAYIISKGPRFTCHLSVYTENLDPDTRFHPGFSFFKKFSCQTITSYLTIFDATTRQLFGYPTISNIPPIQIINTLIQS